MAVTLTVTLHVMNSSSAYLINACVRGKVGSNSLARLSTALPVAGVLKQAEAPTVGPRLKLGMLMTKLRGMNVFLESGIYLR